MATRIERTGWAWEVEVLRRRIDRELGWARGTADRFSLQALRELVRPISVKLAAECTRLIQSGAYIVGAR